jgi:hypothetical protein
MNALYLRQFSAARHRAANDTPDLFASRQFKMLGIQRAFHKLGACPAVDLEKLGEQELEQIRRELAAQLSSRKSRETPPEQTTK